MKVIVAGSRDFSTIQDYILLQETLIPMLEADLIEEIVSGGADGADKLGEAFAKECALPVRRFPADWEKHGKAAGPIRNKQMAEYADCLVAFWDGESRGTKNMIEEANKEGLHVIVINYKEEEL